MTVKIKTGRKGKKLGASKPNVKRHVRRMSGGSDSGSEANTKSSTSTPGRRISFGPNTVRHKHEFTGTPSEANKKLRSSGHTPQGILKVKKTVKSSKGAKEAKKMSFADVDSDPEDEEMIEASADDDAENESRMDTMTTGMSEQKKAYKAELTLRTSTRKIAKLQITRKMKEEMANMSRLEKKKFLREFKIKRRPFGVIAKQCTVYWEVVKSGKSNKAKQKEAIDKIMTIIKGKCSKLIYAHDTVRVIQWLMSMPNRHDIRDALYDELKGETFRMCKSKYARFFVQKMFKHGSPDQREQLFRQFKGKCVEMMRNAYASPILEYAYNDFANAQQRYNIVREFYGQQFVLATMTSGRDIRTLSDVLKAEPEHRESILTHLRQIILALIEKEAIKHSLTHRLMYEYVQQCNEEQRNELVDSVRERCLEATAKDRKTIVRALKGLVAKTAVEEHASLFLMALFDCVDDTVLMKKSIVEELGKNLPSVMESMHGVRFIDYLMNPRDGRYMVKELQTLLAKGDSSSTARKNTTIRRREVRGSIAPAVADHVQRYVPTYLYDKSRSIFVLNVLQCKDNQTVEDISQVPDDIRLKCYETIAEECAKEFIPCNLEDRLHAVEHANAHFVIAKLLKSDRILVAVDKEAVTLTKTLIDNISMDSMCTWTGCNKGCFVLVHMLSSSNVSPSITQALRTKLQKWRQKLCQSSSAGAVALLNAIDGVTKG